MEKLTWKNKHRVKGGNFLYTNISKPAIIRRVQRQNIGNAFEIKRPETYNNLLYMQTAIYINLTVTTNQKSIIHTQKRERYPNSTKHKDQITKRTKEERNQKELQNNLNTINKMAKNIYISITILCII